MKNKCFVIGLVLIIIVVGIWIIGRPEEKLESQDYGQAQLEISEFITEGGMSFEYKTAPGGYVVDDLTAFVDGQVEDTEIVAAYRIMNTKDKEELESSEIGREGPPTINLMIFKNLKNQSASMWADSFPIFSNISLVIGEVNRDAVVGGVNAVTYRADGLYLSENVVIASGGYIYHLIGFFLEEDSMIHGDFKQLIDSIKFIKQNPDISNIKIDPKIACESALAYMLFRNSEDADNFIEECINGQHPDVIERYIYDMGLDKARI